LGAAGATIINSLFSSDAWNNVTFIAGEIKEPKRIYHEVYFWVLIVTVIYILANCLSGSFTHAWHSGASDIAGTECLQVMIRVGAAAAGMIMGNSSVFIMAGLMVSTFGCNSGLILSGGRLFYAMAKDGLFFKQATILNKTKFRQKHYGYNVLGLVCFVFLVSLETC
jgi:APA family basic amino acid/polyamine antiporter